MHERGRRGKSPLGSCLFFLFHLLECAVLEKNTFFISAYPTAIRISSQ